MTVKNNKQQFLCINSFFFVLHFLFFLSMPNSFVSILKDKHENGFHTKYVNIHSIGGKIERKRKKEREKKKEEREKREREEREKREREREREIEMREKREREGKKS